jgi:hypothetical protein
MSALVKTRRQKDRAMLMNQPSIPAAPPPAPAGFPINGAGPNLSPLMLSDRLIGLAQDADRAGLRVTASELVRLACEVLDRPKAPRRRI